MSIMVHRSFVNLQHPQFIIVLPLLSSLLDRTLLITVADIIIILLLTRRFGIEVKDFGRSWRDGYAFNAMIHNIRPDLVDMGELPRNPNHVNLENAFSTAETHLGIPRLLDAEGRKIEC